MKIYFATFGCKVNSSEDDHFLAAALDLGYEKAKDISDSNIIVVNGCAVTSNAAEKCENFIKKIQTKCPDKKLIITGCFVSEKKLKKHNEFLNETLISNEKKNDVIIELARFIGKHNQHNSPSSPFCGGLPNLGSGRTRAFFKIQDGCDACCSYCIIPSLRGEPISKPIDDAVREFKICVDRGFNEIVLVGIHIGLYGRGENYKLCDLLQRLIKIEGDFRIRLTSLEVGEVTEELLHMMMREEKICNHLHIPLQSGSDNILKAMGRHSFKDQYIQTIQKAKSMIDGLTVGSDVIVGFPGETEVDFQDTINTIKIAGTDFLHVFPYSDRVGTKASLMGGKIGDKEKENRSKILREIGVELAKKRLDNSIGKAFRVLTEKNNKGHSSNYLPFIIEGDPIKPNQFKDVLAVEVRQDKIVGKVVSL